MASVLQRVNAFSKRRPLLTSMSTGGLLCSAGDFATQIAVENRSLDKLDRKRNATYLLFGALWNGFFLYGIYTRAYPAVFTAAVDRATVIKKTAFDQMIFSPMFTLPCFYSFMGKRGYFRTEKMRHWTDGLEHYRQELTPTLLINWAIWVPAQYSNFALVPDHLKLPFICSVSFLWNICLITIANAA